MASDMAEGNLKEGEVLFKVDFSNAFNEATREAFMAQVRKYYPELSWVVEWLYGSQPFLYYNGEKILCCEGVQQGCPLGPFLFALLLMKLTDKIGEEYPDIPANVWFLDDGN